MPGSPGWDWTIGRNKTNSVIYGATVANRPLVTYNPQASTSTATTATRPAAPSWIAFTPTQAAGRLYFPIPIVRDDFSWDKGRHSFSFGGTFKYPSPHYSTLFRLQRPGIGLGRRHYSA
jgi:hypothetical protein